MDESARKTGFDVGGGVSQRGGKQRRLNFALLFTLSLVTLYRKSSGSSLTLNLVVAASLGELADMRAFCLLLTSKSLRGNMLRHSIRVRHTLAAPPPVSCSA